MDKFIETNIIFLEQKFIAILNTGNVILAIRHCNAHYLQIINPPLGLGLRDYNSRRA
jgi:hypothetical protein